MLLTEAEPVKIKYLSGVHLGSGFFFSVSYPSFILPRRVYTFLPILALFDEAVFTFQYNYVDYGCYSIKYGSKKLCIQVGSCQGDSGGPLFCSTDGDTWTINGVVSWGPLKCMRRYGVFVNVTYHLEWIDRTLSIYASTFAFFNTFYSNICYFQF